MKPGSTGTAVPGYELRIVDLDERELPPGTIGDLLVAGNSISPGYWNRRKLTAERMRGKWFLTGDKYCIDKDSYYWYAGRSDDMFRVSGQWVSPAEVESALIEHESVLEAAVVAHAEITELHTPKAFIVLREGVVASPDLAQELQEFVKHRITAYKYPRHIQFMTNFRRPTQENYYATSCVNSIEAVLPACVNPVEHEIESRCERLRTKAPYS